MKNEKDTSETATSLQRFLLVSRMPTRIFTDNSKEFVKTFQDLKRDHDTGTHHHDSWSMRFHFSPS